MYLIEILHQTTTPDARVKAVPLLYLIEILHQTTTSSRTSATSDCCILSKFYIKPQPPQRAARCFGVVSYRNSTSNHNHPEIGSEPRLVVSYRNSTSNHNSRAAGTISAGLYLIEILHQTTTLVPLALFPPALYLIEILHQTTTSCCLSGVFSWLYLIEILHQTTTWNTTRKYAGTLYLIEILHQTTTPRGSFWFRPGCILSKFYIKPQQVFDCYIRTIGCILSKFYIKPQREPGTCRTTTLLYLIEILHQTTTWPRCLHSGHPVVSYRNSTSNHNGETHPSVCESLYLIEILHQTTTLLVCIGFTCQLYLIEILHQTTTSLRLVIIPFLLYLIEILHQTTTGSKSISGLNLLYLIEILHQTTTSFRARAYSLCCILSKFYIKPQLARCRHYFRWVVSYRNSTSNHNRYLR